jgi:hypothetical protein
METRVEVKMEKAQGGNPMGNVLDQLDQVVGRSGWRLIGWIHEELDTAAETETSGHPRAGLRQARP